MVYTHDISENSSLADDPPTDNPSTDNGGGGVGALDRELRVTKFPNLQAGEMEVLVVSVRGLASHMANIHSAPVDASPEALQAAKKRLPLFSGCAFGDKRTAAGTLRSNGNVLSLDCIFVEHDDGSLPMDQAEVGLAKADLAAFLYTTTSHTKAHQRYRIVAPLSKPCPPKDHARFVARVNGALKGALASESFTLSQAYYGGVVVRENYQMAFVEGRFIDEADDLDAGAIGKEGGQSKQHQAGNDTFHSGDRVFGGNMKLLASVVMTIPAKEHEIHDLWLSVIMAINHESGGSAEGLAIAIDWSRGCSNFDEEELRRRWASLGREREGRPITGAYLLKLAYETGGLSDETLLLALSGLVERSMDDPGAPFEPLMLAAARALRARNLAQFMRLRALLKDAKIPIVGWDKALGGSTGTGEEVPSSDADILVALAPAELFHAPDGTGFGDLDVNGHRETWPIRSKGFCRWLARTFFKETGSAPSSEALRSALNVIEAKAYFDGPERIVYVRVGGVDDKLYLDLCDTNWRMVEIDTTGWRIIDSPPVRFRRTSGMQPLPEPIPGGWIETLRLFLNVRSEADFVLVVSSVLAYLRNSGPYPVLVLSGEQGSAKSTFSAIVRALVDPNTTPLRGLSREERDLFIAATNGHVLAFDNVSSLPQWISDALCPLATGGGFAVRQLYTDQDEVLFDAQRPVILNGIEDIVARPDLADRAVSLTLEPIPEECRRPEAELWAAFEAERPRILGVLLDALVEGLKRLPGTHLPKLPRMADFALWATACETAFWPAGTFLSAYSGNLDEAVDNVIDADPIAVAVREMMQTRTVWAGTASALLADLKVLVGDRIANAKIWPGSPKALAGRLRRAATFLRKVGIEISFGRAGRARTRTITITATQRHPAPEQSGAQPSASSASSASAPKSNPDNDLGMPDLRTVGGGQCGR